MTSVTPGDVIFTEFDFTTAAAAVVAGGFTDYIQLTKVVIAPGSVLLKAGEDYCTTNNTLFALAGNPVGVACLRDTDGDGMFDRIAGGNLIATDFPPLPYRSDAVGTGTGFRKELLYQGVQGDTMRLSYREFANDMARPAFQQDLTYNLEKPGPMGLMGGGWHGNEAGTNHRFWFK